MRRASSWVQLVDERAEAALVRPDRAATLHRLALALLEHSDASKTTRPTWAVLQNRTGRSRATVARGLVTLRAWGLLGIVASGRQGVYAPRGRGTDAAVPTNEAAVYVLAERSPVRLVADLEDQVHPSNRKSVDEDETPPRKGLILPPAHARENPSETESRPLRVHDPSQAAQARQPEYVLQQRPGHWFPTSATAGGKDAALRAAHELRVRLPVLRRISSRHVRSILRDFFAAGWTVGDVILAIDRLPSGSHWRHDGATSVENVGAWMRHRLRPWRTHDNQVRASPSQRAAAAHAEARARSRARLEAERAIERARPDVVAEAMAQIRATLAGGARR